MVTILFVFYFVVNESYMEFNQAINLIKPSIVK